MLLQRISGGLRPGGKWLFARIAMLIYPFETERSDDWMGRHFFTGGLMPAADTFMRFQRHMVIEQQWGLHGAHHQKTANSWPANRDAHGKQILAVPTDTYGENAAGLWHQRWRMFWIAGVELPGFADGHEWRVGHYRFRRRPD